MAPALEAGSLEDAAGNLAMSSALKNGAVLCLLVGDDAAQMLEEMQGCLLIGLRGCLRMSRNSIHTEGMVTLGSLPGLETAQEKVE